MLETLISLIHNSWRVITPYTIIDEFEAGVILRVGRYHRRAPPGGCWKIPIIEELLTASTVLTTLQLSPQTLTTNDDTQLVIASIIKYEIKDVKAYLLNIFNQTDVLNDVVLGAVQRSISNKKYIGVLNAIDSLEMEVLKDTRKEVTRFGFKVHKITFGTIGRIKSIRLITDWEPPDE